MELVTDDPESRKVAERIRAVLAKGRAKTTARAAARAVVG